MCSAIDFPLEFALCLNVFLGNEKQNETTANSIKKRKFIELFESKWNTYDELFKYPLGIYLERTETKLSGEIVWTRSVTQ